MTHPLRKLTLEKAEAIAEILKSPYETLTSATVRVGLSPGTTRQAMIRYDKETCSDDEFDIVQIIAEALQDQFCEHRKTAELAALDPKTSKMTAWKQWRLETAAPSEHAKLTKNELSGPDGGALEFSSLSLEKLLSLAGDDE